MHDYTEEVAIQVYDNTPEEEIADGIAINPGFACIVFKAPENSQIETELSFELEIDINGSIHTETLSAGQIVVINNIPAEKIYPVKCSALLPTGGVYATGSINARMTPGEVSTLNLVMRRVGETASSYVEFGMWPQTIKAAGINVDESDTKVVGIFTYYKGDDGAWYVKQQEKADQSGYYYSDGTEVARSGANSFKFFKVEPIRWIVLTDNYSGKKLLHSEKILIAHRFASGSHYSYYYYSSSEIRSWLNDDFYNTAFTSEEKSRIPLISVDMSPRSTNPDSNPYLWNGGNNSFASGTASGRVFLLSEQEVTKSDYGFADYDVYKGDSNGTAESTRIRMNTDFAKASGANQNTNDGYGGWWWLRSPLWSDNYNVHNVGANGSANGTYNVTNYTGGVCPALCINN